jgi:hypothetical protein
MVAEGEPKDLDAMLDALKRQMEGFIRKLDVTTGPATGEFAGFTIRH